MNASHATRPTIDPLARLLYGCYLGALGLGLAFIALALGESSPILFIRGVAGGLIALLVRGRLASNGRLAALAEEDDSPVRRQELRPTATDRLVARCVAMEKLRGTAAFDTWEYNSLRSAIAAKRAGASRPPPLPRP